MGQSGPFGGVVPPVENVAIKMNKNFDDFYLIKIFLNLRGVFGFAVVEASKKQKQLKSLSFFYILSYLDRNLQVRVHHTVLKER